MCCIIKSVIVLAVFLAVQQRGVNCDEREVGTLLIAGGRQTPSVTAPWNVGLFRAAGPEDPGTFDFKCGGTLITKTLVITAGHCLHTFQGHTHKIALGKFRREWNDTEHSLQRKDIKRSVIHPRYRGNDRNFEHDICVIELTTSAELTRSVQLAEAVWSDALRTKLLTNGNLGLVAGWGNQLSGEPSYTLRSIDLPYVDAQSCEASVAQVYKKLVTHDKFCAGYRNQNKSVCKGDSGSGLTFRDPANNITYLAGITSVAFRTETSPCITQNYAAFTDVTEHHNQQWLKTFLSAGEKNNTSGYHMLAGLTNEYKFHIEAATWQDAKRVCEEEGAHLVIINSDSESAAVAALNKKNMQNIVGSSHKRNSWVGVSESLTENGKYFTVLGQRLQDTGFMQWSKSYTNYESLGDVLFLGSGSGALSDIPAADNEKQAFACETGS